MTSYSDILCNLLHCCYIRDWHFLESTITTIHLSFRRRNDNLQRSKPSTKYQRSFFLSINSSIHRNRIVLITSQPEEMSESPICFKIRKTSQLREIKNFFILLSFFRFLLRFFLLFYIFIFLVLFSYIFCVL